MESDRAFRAELARGIAYHTGRAQVKAAQGQDPSGSLRLAALLRDELAARQPRGQA